MARGYPAFVLLVTRAILSIEFRARAFCARRGSPLNRLSLPLTQATSFEWRCRKQPFAYEEWLRGLVVGLSKFATLVRLQFDLSAMKGGARTWSDVGSVNKN